MDSLDSQAKHLHEQVVELIKKYQFRDRTATCCYDISVSQCYILETLNREGPLTMQQLARCMHLAPSTVTRVVGQLVGGGYVVRREGPSDRRRRLIELTRDGRRLTRQLWAQVLESERRILTNFPAEHRESLIKFLQQLNDAVDEWKQDCCSLEGPVGLTASGSS